MTRAKRLIGTTATLAVLATPAAASAASRYASPSGSGTACTQAAPCDIATAINNAGPGDDITIEPGTYTPNAPELQDTGHTLTIHGQSGQPRPVINGLGPDGFVLTGANTSLSDVELDMSLDDQTGIFAFNGTNVTIDRVVVRMTGVLSNACIVDSSATITNSLCLAAGTESDAFVSSAGTAGQHLTVTLRNDTLEATGPPGTSAGYGLGAVAVSGATVAVPVSNSIARGTGSDILANPNSTITADHSNYGVVSGSGGTATPAGSGTNQTNFPKFVNAAAGDFHELASSPTVNAGADASVNGQFDLDGNPRQFGAATDIGAYEYVPPPTCQPVTATTSSGTAVTIQLACTDATGAPLTYAITGNPSHGTVSVDPSTGRATYTPAAGYSGNDSFSFSATSNHGTGASASASVTVTAGSTPPRDSKPKLSPTKFAPLASGPSIVAARARGTLISYTDTQSATTVFTVQRAIGTGVISHGKCVKAASGRKGRKCIRYRKIGRFKHHDSAGLNRFRFSGRMHGKALPRGHYRLLSKPVNAAGKAGASHTNFFTIVR